MTLFADVVLPLPLDRSFIYSVPEEFRRHAAVGVRVLVSFNRRLLTGIVVGLSSDPPSGGFQVKPVRELLETRPSLTPDLLEFTRELSELSLVSWGEMLQAALPPSLLPRSRTRYQVTPEGRTALKNGIEGEEEGRLLARLEKSALSESYLKRSLKILRTGALLSRLERRGWIQRENDVERISRRKIVPKEIPARQLRMDFSLDSLSMKSVRRLTERMTSGGFSPSLVRGPRKIREAVYLELIRTSLRLKKRVLYLVPEIILTESAADRLRTAVGSAAALLHSRLSERQREIEWRRIRNGEVDVVLGARSALLAPVKDLGLVILDEEQDDSYFQTESPVTDARRGAWLLSRRSGALLVFGSPRPSIELWHRSRAGGWLEDLSTTLVSRRVAILDDRAEKGLVKGAAGRKIRERLGAGERVLVFCNRRGYAPFLACVRCGHVPRCPRCRTALSYHKRRHRMVCHACNSSSPVLESCPECGGRLAGRKGVGVEVVEEALRQEFPGSRIEGFSADEAGTEKKRRDLLRRFEQGRIDVLVGTVLLARRMESPRVPLIVIYYPEIGLDLPDFRMGQKTFEEISRMAAHLSPDPGAELVIRTALPDHFSILTAAVGDYREFAEQELEYRRLLGYPPFTRMAEVILEGEDLRALGDRSREFVHALKRENPDLEIMGPALAPVPRLRGRSRVQVLVKTDQSRDLGGTLRTALRGIPGRRRIFLFK